MKKDIWHPHERVSQLGSASDQLEAPPDWLKESWKAPDAFFRGLKRSLDALFPIAGASALFTRYDLYHDIVNRNRTNPEPALVFYGASGKKQALSWEELGRDASIKAAKWGRHGVKSGETLCLVREEGLDFATDLLAAFRLGVVVSVLSPEGAGWLTPRLEALSPHWIATDKKNAEKLGDFKDRVLTHEAGACDLPSDHRSFHGYASQETVLKLFPSASACDPLPVEVSSDTFYLGCARDGLLGMGLYPGMGVCAPGFDLVQCQPMLLVSALLCGATTFFLKDRKGIPEDASIDILGVTPEYRDGILEGEFALSKGPAVWFRDPVGSLAYDRWQLLSTRPEFMEAFSLNLRWDAAKGGCTLFSLRKKGLAHPGGLPVAGSLFSIGEEGSEEAALFQAGELLLGPPGEGEGELSPTGLFLAAHGKSWLCTRGPSLARGGRCYPAEEVESLLRARFLQPDFYFRILSFPRMDLEGGAQVVLLGFTGARAGGAFLKQLKREVGLVIAREMGASFLPDSSFFYPLYPRCEEEKVPCVSWCKDAWLSGALAKKTRSPVVRCMTEIRSKILNAPDTDGAAF